MKVSFFQKLNTRLFIIPLLAMLFVFIVGGFAFYYFVPLYLFNDYPKSHLAGLVSEKKLTLDTWFEQHRRHVEYLSGNPAIRDNLLILGSAPVNSGSSQRKIINLVSGEIQVKTSKLLEDMAQSSHLRMLSVLSKEGKVLSSSRKELVGEDWSDKPLVKDMLSGANPSSMSGFYGEGGGESGVVFLSPVFDANESMAAVLYAVANVDSPARFLGTGSSTYKSEKVELIDMDGNLLLSKRGTPERRLRYNIPRNGKENISGLRDNLFFYVANLDNVPFRLIGTIEKPEIMRPFTVLSILFFAFAGLLVLVMAYQSGYLAPKIVTKPLSRLVSA
ncbi:MAG TPA: cache domain-containing protein, partial [Dissulfurispiraceae bacterium]